MSAITLKVPNSLTENKIDTIKLIASKLYVLCKLSLGHAADIDSFDDGSLSSQF